MRFIEQLKERIGQILTALAIAAITYTASSLTNMNIELAKVTTTVQNMNQNLAIFATKEELKRVEQKIDAHLDEFKRLHAQRLAREEASRKAAHK